MFLLETLAHLFHPRFSNNHRPRVLHPEGFAVLAFLVIVSGVVIHQLPYFSRFTGAVLGYSSEISASTVIEKTNQQRAAIGLPALQFNSKLSEAAAAKANDMFQDQYWAHFSPSGKAPWDFMKAVGYRYTVAGENLARDFMHSDDMMRAWMNSPTHRDNIINPKYQDIGIAVVNGKLNGVETTLVVQMFGTLGNTTTVAAIGDSAQQVVESPAEVNSEKERIVVEEIQQEIQPVVETFDEPVEVMHFASLSQAEAKSEVLATSVMGRLSQGESPILLSPLYLTKAFFLALLMVLISVLLYDTIVIGHRGTVRFVGKNAAHFMLFMTIFFLVLLFRGGVIA